MSRPGWEWRDGSGGAGHLQRIAATARFSASQRAYNAYLDHWGTCVSCDRSGPRCPEADALWKAYQTALGSEAP
ncbi:hypothetical protein [Streptomyces griseosporeus]|uniref:hypothetical protein n=1 Tax=Streptomyces griseosporeus TaxID=1910 RepID=UPI00167CF3E8|nr:hypothetical protein [Streptomyces griseosporeus]GHF57788.1 hypothetical protein GCM10018783_28960 [Streptomyces griseosporeus]